MVDQPALQASCLAACGAVINRGSCRQMMLTSSSGEQVASTACQMDCLAPLLTTISSGLYCSWFSLCSLWQMACLRAAVPVFGV